MDGAIEVRMNRRLRRLHNRAPKGTPFRRVLKHGVQIETEYHDQAGHLVPVKVPFRKWTHPTKGPQHQRCSMQTAVRLVLAERFAKQSELKEAA